IVIDHAGKFAYVTDDVAGTIYILGVDPKSNSFYTCIRTIGKVPGALQHGPRGLHITNDDKWLCVAAPPPDADTPAPTADTEGQILLVDLDPQHLTYRQVVSSLKADQAPYAVRATADPKVMLFTNFLSDRTGLGIIRKAESGAPTVEQYPLEFANDKLG